MKLIIILPDTKALEAFDFPETHPSENALKKVREYYPKCSEDEGALWADDVNYISNGKTIGMLV